uniref:G protein-coupled receptor 146 n=1 Tax=Mus musculus TaxID=10090 RepID=Q8C3F6_MOUSE|nr:RIKEN cDNA D830046C22 gene [Mus musculus]AAI47360.1 RIKEN cDNA D830046C22 gene [Mus musculus]BAC39596.1 unnamed protein product [Mus musculus]
MLSKRSTNLATAPSPHQKLIINLNIFPAPGQCPLDSNLPNNAQMHERKWRTWGTGEDRCNPTTTPSPRKTNATARGNRAALWFLPSISKCPCGMQLILSTATPEQPGRPAKSQECGPGREVPGVSMALGLGRALGCCVS